MTEGESGRAYWDRHAKNYSRSMLVLGKPLPRILELTQRAVAGAGEVLEVAAGTGLFTARIAPQVRKLVATDYSSAMVSELEQAVRRIGLRNVECKRADLYALDYAPRSFDAVVAANVLHLIPDLEQGLSCLRGVLRPGGKLIVPTFCHDETRLSRLFSRAIALTGFPGRRRFNAETLEAALGKAGVRIARTEMVPGVIPILYVEGIVNAS